MKKIYVILVNYNTPYDTMECVQSLLNQIYSNIQIIIIDNSENVQSYDLIHKWTQNQFDIIPTSSFFRDYLYPRKIKTISVSGSNELTKETNIIYHKTKNEGFAAACNEGIKIAETMNDYDYVWLLNNDAVVDKNSLLMLLNGFEKYKNNNVGVCGSKILFYDEPNIVQSLGRIQLSLFRLSHIAYEKQDIYYEDILVDEISGASMLISKEYIDNVGLMPEEYFLYMEETDWNYSGKQKGYNFYSIASSKVYHKESLSTGGRFSYTNIYYNTRNKIHFLRKYSKNFYFLLLIFVIYKVKDISKFLMKKEFNLAKGVCMGIINGIRKTYGR